VLTGIICSTRMRKCQRRTTRIIFLNPILHTWFRDSCFTCDGSPTILNSTVLFKMSTLQIILELCIPETELAKTQVFCHWTIKADTSGFHISILVPIRTTKDSFLPVTFTGLADLFPQLGSLHQQLCGDTMYLAWVVQYQNTNNCCRGPGFESCV
jgi:hypothetical protein